MAIHVHVPSLDQYPIFFVANSLLQRLKPRRVTPVQLQHALYLVAEMYYKEKEGAFPFHDLFTATSLGPSNTQVSLHLLSNARKPITKYLSMDGRPLFVDDSDRYMNSLLDRAVYLIKRITPSQLAEAVMAEGTPWKKAVDEGVGDMELDLFDECDTFSRLCDIADNASPLPANTKL